VARGESEDVDETRSHLHACIDGIRVLSFPYMRYAGDSYACEILEREFRMINATRFRAMLKTMCFAAELWLFVYLTLQTEKKERFFFSMIVLGVLVVHIIYSWNVLYFFNTQLLVGTCALAGGIAIIYNSITTLDVGNMVLMLYVIAVFTSTPLTLRFAIAITAPILIVKNALTFIAQHRAAAKDEAILDVNALALLSLTTFLSFSFLVYVKMHREIFQRQAILSKHLLLLKTLEVEAEMEKTKNLVRSMLPPVIVDQLQERDENHGSVLIAEKFSAVTVLFLEVCDFNEMTTEVTSEELVDILNALYSCFDSVISDYDIYKVETISEVYMVVAGCPGRTRSHPEDAAEVALEFFSLMPDINNLLQVLVPSLQRQVQIRIGINSGPIVAGVVGIKAPRFKLFGDTVNTASRMESTCPPSRIQCTDATYKSLRKEFEFEKRGKIPVKGKGEMTTYFLQRRKDTFDTRKGRNILVSDKIEMRDHMENSKSSRMHPINSGFRTSRSRRRVTASSKVTPSGSTLSRIPSFLNYKGSARSLSTGSQRDLLLESSSSRSGGRREVDMRVLKRSKSTERLFKFNVDNAFTFFQASSVQETLRDLMSASSPDFREDQLKQGIETIGKVSRILLLFLPFAVAIELAIIGLIDSSQSSFIFQVAFFGLTVLLFFGSLLIRELLKREQNSWKISAVVICEVLFFTAYLIVVNMYGERPNASFMMTLITVVFNLQVLSMKQRVLLTLLPSIIMTGAVAAKSRAKDFKRYMIHQDDLDDNIFTSPDLLQHFTYLLITIFLQGFCVAIQDLYLYQDFCQKKMIRSQVALLHTQKAKTTTLLSQLLPPSIVPQMIKNDGKGRIVDFFPSVTILFTDMVGFTKFSRSISPLNLLEFLQSMFLEFDGICEEFGLYKVEIIGDAYFMVGGCPEISNDHTKRVVEAASRMLKSLDKLTSVARKILAREKLEKERALAKEQRMENITKTYLSDSEDARTQSMDLKVDPVEINAEEIDIKIRIGIHAGPVIAGVVGTRDFRYHLFGNSVGVANLLECKGEPNKIHVSKDAVENLMASPGAQDLFEATQSENIVDLSPYLSPQHTFFVKSRDF